MYEPMVTRSLPDVTQSCRWSPSPLPWIWFYVEGSISFRRRGLLQINGKTHWFSHYLCRRLSFRWLCWPSCLLLAGTASTGIQCLNERPKWKSIYTRPISDLFEWMRNKCPWIDSLSSDLPYFASIFKCQKSQDKPQLHYFPTIGIVVYGNKVQLEFACSSKWPSVLKGFRSTPFSSWKGFNRKFSAASSCRVGVPKPICFFVPLVIGCLWKIFVDRVDFDCISWKECHFEQNSQKLWIYDHF